MQSRRPIIGSSVDERLVRARQAAQGRGGAASRPRNTELRRRYVWATDGGEHPAPAGWQPPAARLAARAGPYGTRIRLHLLLLWIAGAREGSDYHPLFATDLSYRKLRELLALPDSDSGQASLKGAIQELCRLGYITDAPSTLRTGEKARRLTLMWDVPEPPATTGAHVDPSPYVHPLDCQPPYKAYAKIPPAIWTNGWATWLPVNALLLLLLLFERNADNWPFVLHQRNADARQFLATPQDRTQAQTILHGAGLMAMTEPIRSQKLAREMRLVPAGLNEPAPTGRLKTTRSGRRLGAEDLKHELARMSPDAAARLGLA